MSILAIADKLLGIFQKRLKLKADPSYRIERQLEAIEKEEKRIVEGKHTPDSVGRLITLRDERKRLLEEQARLAARAT